MENQSTNRVLSDEANNEQLRPTAVTGSPKFIPILFSTPMVQAVLDGRKTQTRRAIKNIEIIENDFGNFNYSFKRGAGSNVSKEDLSDDFV